MLETLLVLAVIGIIMGVVFRSSQSTPQVPVHEDAMIFLRAFETAYRQASAEEKQMRLLIDQGSHLTAGRIATLTQSIGEPAPADFTRWKTLHQDVMFDWGTALTGPLGDTIRAAVPLDQVLCVAGEGCSLVGNQTSLTYYFQSILDPETVRAVVLTASGSGRLYRYESGMGEWR
jgi:type II secretory pathway pseudopilin PulG